MRLAFMGSPDFAVPVLAALRDAGHDIVAVYAQPARPKGRGKQEQPTPVAAFAAEKGLVVRTPKSLRGPAEQAEFAALNMDAAIVVAYGLLLPKAVLDAPRLGCFNLHGSLLPRWRGAAPIQRAIMAGDTTTGVMVMHMDEGLDTGPWLSVAKTDIGRKTAGALMDELSVLGAELMVRTLKDVEAGTAVETAQVEDGATYAKKILKDEARIDWSLPADVLDCHIRGISPFPGAWCEVRGERLKVLLAEPVSGSGTPGVVQDDAPTIACGSGALRLVTVQRAGRGVVSAAEFQRGFALKAGEVVA